MKLRGVWPYLKLTRSAKSPSYPPEWNWINFEASSDIIAEAEKIDNKKVKFPNYPL